MRWFSTVFHYANGLCLADLLWSNPQFGIDLKESDDVDADGNLTVVVSLMQKATTLQYDDLYISFFVYKVCCCFITICSTPGLLGVNVELHSK